MVIAAHDMFEVGKPPPAVSTNPQRPRAG